MFLVAVTLAAVEVPLALLEIGAILFALGLTARLTKGIGLSSIPLFLLLGLLLGEGGVVPVATATGFIEIGAQIGVVVLLLMLGLEYTADELKHGLRRGWSRARTFRTRWRPS